jgi:hypothetical protein
LGQEGQAQPGQAQEGENHGQQGEALAIHPPNARQLGEKPAADQPAVKEQQSPGQAGHGQDQQQDQPQAYQIQSIAHQ